MLGHAYRRGSQVVCWLMRAHVSCGVPRPLESGGETNCPVCRRRNDDAIRLFANFSTGDPTEELGELAAARAEISSFQERQTTIQEEAAHQLDRPDQLQTLNEFHTMTLMREEEENRREITNLRKENDSLRQCPNQELE